MRHHISADSEFAVPPEQSSLLFSIGTENATYNQYGYSNNFVTDQDGYNKWIKGEASTFLKASDPRLLLNTIVTNVTYSNVGVTVYISDSNDDENGCIEADYAIATFSLGVLQNGAVAFDPALPHCKKAAIHSFDLALYTRIFYQFPKKFWPSDGSYHLYADPTTRGYWPAWQSLDENGYHLCSGIIFATVTGSKSERIEKALGQ